ncbi:hypothetical protein LRS10_21010 [Phenylobacterium sp. J426]|uniref:hypothetical protein n=1 Tax=Phenylobacterium sp. J426 TaxID=2898439 RepID=UPI002150AFFA|nr:hypothetical protein [Phenylobacterium sp. J426]MCR5876403.1 hypothetical protein [Phenylobacterium sp. J426]
MKFAAIFVAAAALASAGSSFASERVSDMDYMKASRCKGLATTLTGVVDASSIDAYLKSARSSRSPAVYERADSEFDKAKREARSEDRKTRLTAELTGPCSAYLGAPASMAKR